MSALDSRLAALYILKRFQKQQSWTSETISSAQSKYHLDSRDTALSASLSKSVLEHQYLIDFYLDHYSNIPLNQVNESVLDVLRIGVTQILYMDRIPDSAAVDTAVSCCRISGHKKACGYVNAILRSIIRSKDTLPEPDHSDPEQYLSTIYSHPKWLVTRLLKEYGSDHTEKFLSANNQIDARYLQINHLTVDNKRFEELLTQNDIPFSIDTKWPASLQITNTGKIDQIPGYQEGYFYIQDPAAHEVASIADIHPDMSILDCCAAPGGKTISAAVRMKNKGKITACDINEKKLHFIDENCQRLHIKIVDFSAHDARQPFSGLFDVVLADVPCSGMGVIRKRPEIRYKKEEDLLELPKIQYSILENVSKNVKHGGILMYSTCSILKEENEDIISRFLAKHDDYSLVPFDTCGQHCDGMFTYWPQTHHTDGFFVCKLMKTN